MAKRTVLVIDDEMYLSGSKKAKYGRLSEADLALKLKSVLEGQGLMVDFCKTGEDGLAKIKQDRQKTIRLVLLDIRFTRVDTKWRGPTVLRKVKEVRPDMPVVIITASPARKLPQTEDIFKELVQLGCSLYIEKNFFSKGGEEQINYLNSLVKGENVRYVVKCNQGQDSYGKEMLRIDILRKDAPDELSVLKHPHRIYLPMSTYMKACFEQFPEPVHRTEVTTSLTDLEFHKAVHKLNDTVMRSSGGRIPNLLERLGRSGCRINPFLISEIRM